MVADSMFYYERKKESGDIVPKIVVFGCVCMWCKESHTTPHHTHPETTIFGRMCKESHTSEHGLQPRAPISRAPPSQFSFAFYTGLPTVPYNIYYNIYYNIEMSKTSSAL